MDQTGGSMLDSPKYKWMKAKEKLQIWHIAVEFCQMVDSRGNGLAAYDMFPPEENVKPTIDLPYIGETDTDSREIQAAVSDESSVSKNINKEVTKGNIGPISVDYDEVFDSNAPPPVKEKTFKRTSAKGVETEKVGTDINDQISDMPNITSIRQLSDSGRSRQRRDSEKLTRTLSIGAQNDLRRVDSVDGDKEDPEKLSFVSKLASLYDGGESVILRRREGESQSDLQFRKLNRRSTYSEIFQANRWTSTDSRKSTLSEIMISKLSIEEIDKQWFIAASFANLSSLKALYKQDHELINKKDFCSGYAAIHWAAKQGKSEVIKWLVSHDADVDIKSNGGYTPLHFAVMHEHDALVTKFVEEYGSNIDIRDHSGRKAKHYLKPDCSATIALLLQAPELVIATATDTKRSNFQHRKSLHQTSFDQQSNHLVNGLTEKPIPTEDEHKKKKRSLSIANSFKRQRRKDRRPATTNDLYPESPRSPSKYVRSPKTPLSPEVLKAKHRSKSLAAIQHPHLQAGDNIDPINNEELKRTRSVADKLDKPESNNNVFFSSDGKTDSPKITNSSKVDKTDSPKVAKNHLKLREPSSGKSISTDSKTTDYSQSSPSERTSQISSPLGVKLKPISNSTDNLKGQFSNSTWV